MKDTYTFQEFCSDRGITPEWLTSKEGNLTIGSETQRLPDDELIVGGNLEIANESLTRLPERVIVAGCLYIEGSQIVEFPKYIEVMGPVVFRHTSFVRMHDQCLFHNSIYFHESKISQLPDNYHVRGSLYLIHCSIEELPKGLLVDGKLKIMGGHIRIIPDDCRCECLDARKSKVEKIPDNWSVKYLKLEDSAVSELSKGLRVSEMLNISRTAIREIPEVLPGIDLVAQDAQLEKLPDNWPVRSLNLTGNPISMLPKGLKVQWTLIISRTAIRTIPEDSYIGYSIIARDSQLTEILGRKVMAGTIGVTGSPISRISSDIICKEIVCDKRVKVETYRFHLKKAIDFHPNGKYVVCDDIFSEVVEHKGNVWRCVDIKRGNEHYIVTDGKRHYAHGETIDSAKLDLRFKVNKRTLTDYRKLKLDDSLSFEDAYTCYREITGACRFGTDQFIQSLSEVKESYTIREIIELTKGKYGHSTFAWFFHAA